jgi:hypothetical protein
MWMSDDFENMDLSRDSFDIRHINDLFLFKDLDSNLFACKNMLALFDFAEGSFPDILA